MKEAEAMRYIRLKTEVMQKIAILANDVTLQYTCPKECKAWCCRISTIKFSEKEYNKIMLCSNDSKQKLLKDSTRKIADNEAPRIIVAMFKRATGDAPFRTMITNPCAFLNTHNECDVYQERPRFCQSYPITLDESRKAVDFNESRKASTVDAVRVIPCALGVDLILDYVCFLIEKTFIPLQMTDIIDNQTFSDLYVDLFKIVIGVIKSKPDIITNSFLENNVQMFTIPDPVNTLSEFELYLKNKPLDGRIINRKSLLEDIIQCEFDTNKMNTFIATTFADIFTYWRTMNSELKDAEKKVLLEKMK